MKRNALLLCMMFLAAAVFADGPFGLTPGMTVKQLYALCPDAKDLGNGYYMVQPVGYQDGDFVERVEVIIHPKHGLVCATGISYEIDTLDSGEDLKDSYILVRDQFANHLGRRFKSEDYANGNGKYTYNWSYMVGLFHGDRRMSSEWSVWKDGMERVVVLIMATSEYHGRVLMTFYLDGYEACSAELPKRKN